MHIDKYKQPNGWYKYPEVNGCDYERPEDLLGEMVHFCGCGRPILALRYLAKAMRLVLNQKKSNWDTKTYEELNGFFRSDGEKYFTFYMLDHFGFTEHGGSVPGSLTQRGVEFLEDVESLPVDTE